MRHLLGGQVFGWVKRKDFEPSIPQNQVFTMYGLKERICGRRLFSLAGKKRESRVTSPLGAGFNPYSASISLFVKTYC